MSVAELIAELATLESDQPEDENDIIAELDRCRAAVEAGGRTVPRSEVVRWLEGWGTPDFKPGRQHQR